MSRESEPHRAALTLRAISRQDGRIVCTTYVVTGPVVVSLDVPAMRDVIEERAVEIRPDQEED